uniref:3'-5' exonuclease domain-containing protein n=1 Tax=Chromera velia CCMP2878 TaxID=1169474 RepID=A0A0G4I7A2_9ALVE|eukprot:Cvel_11639.t1-p1 / transcript=Cvel_11639.t1 / gene=Cvel_11639 / organism=Chromera_velia_CCMP2878 / gene_product=hypothetical protein / transcript_product=hypothetical protein / location=Cvel_scaffold737:27510-30114(+) / protein_length=525 / sequence_SO=supercontig / SO=protein_coding / is_pseudo=false
MRHAEETGKGLGALKQECRTLMDSIGLTNAIGVVERAGVRSATVVFLGLLLDSRDMSKQSKKVLRQRITPVLEAQHIDISSEFPKKAAEAEDNAARYIASKNSVEEGLAMTDGDPRMTAALGCAYAQKKKWEAASQCLLRLPDPTDRQVTVAERNAILRLQKRAQNIHVGVNSEKGGGKNGETAGKGGKGETADSLSLQSFGWQRRETVMVSSASSSSSSSSSSTAAEGSLEGSGIECFQGLEGVEWIDTLEGLQKLCEEFESFSNTEDGALLGVDLEWRPQLLPPLFDNRARGADLLQLAFLSPKQVAQINQAVSTITALPIDPPHTLPHPRVFLIDLFTLKRSNESTGAAEKVLTIFSSKFPTKVGVDFFRGDWDHLKNLLPTGYTHTPSPASQWDTWPSAFSGPKAWTWARRLRRVVGFHPPSSRLLPVAMAQGVRTERDRVQGSPEAGRECPPPPPRHQTQHDQNPQRVTAELQDKKAEQPLIQADPAASASAGGASQNHSSSLSLHGTPSDKETSTCVLQ